MWAHSLRIRGPRQSIPIALVGSKQTSDSNSSEVEIDMSERVEDNEAENQEVVTQSN